MKIFTRSLSLALLAALFNFQTKAQTPGVALSYSTDDFLQLPNNILNGVTGDFTIEAWVFWNGPSGNRWQRIFDFGRGINGGNVDKYMYLTPSGEDQATLTNRMIFAIADFGCCEQRIVAPAELTPNTWNHIAVTLDNTNNIGTIFLNGTAVASAPISYDVNTILPTTQNTLGQSQYYPLFPDPFYNGVIDEFRISNVVRYTANFTPQQTQFATDGNTVALYHFNEGSGQTTADASGNGFTATLGATTSAEASDPTWTTGSILPITISQFSARKNNTIIDLSWVANVTGNGGQIIIERSTNGTNYQAIGTINVGANAGTSSYSFTDRQFNTGRNYYRLRIVEAGVADKYSTVVLVDAGNKLYTAYPSVVTTELYVRIPKATTIVIYNSNGVLVRKLQLQSSQNINLSDLSKGTYQLQFEDVKETVRFVKM
jgi:hypothetical protein